MTLAYDARNRCVSRTVAGTATYYYFDNWNLLEERDASDGELEKYVHGATVDELINKIDSTGTVYYLYNALGNATALTSPAGAIIEQYSYDIFGAPTMTDGSGNPLTASAYNNRFLFTGREYLAGLNLYDYRNRVYSPGLGRFLQIDPIRLSRDPSGKAGGNNLYAYVLNNPLLLVDKLGLSFDITGNEEIDAGLEAWARAAQGIANAYTGGLFDPKSGLFYDDFNSRWNNMGEPNNENSSDFNSGLNGGRISVAAFAAAGVIEASGLQSRIALHGAHHQFGPLGRLCHLQLNTWWAGVKGSGWAFRIPLPWW
jgi:RHS repeat-associated protein